LREESIMEKPSFKFVVVFNLVMNIPMAAAMSIGGMVFSGNASKLFTPALAVNILIGFVLACIINALFPIQGIAMKFPTLFKLDPESLPGHLVGNIPIVALFCVIIGLVMNFINVQIFAGAKAPAFLFAFLGTFIPCYILCFVVAMIFIPVAQKAAAATM
jgi:hypothetical protein